MWAIIGGSGFESFSQVEEVEKLPTQTPYGAASPGLRKIRVRGRECVFLPRHGSRHELLPSEINYRANLFALKRAGVTRVLSLSAVGSLQKELAPGHLVVPHQYIDRTKGFRAATYCGDGIVGHISLAEPTWLGGAKAIRALAGKLDFSTHFERTYVCIDGPAFSTRAESMSYRQAGADIIGMTNFPEYALAREAGLAYLPCSFVTDYDCWDPTIEHVTLQMVIDTMKKNNEKAFTLVTEMLKTDPAIDDSVASGSLKANLLGAPSNELLGSERFRVLFA